VHQSLPELNFSCVFVGELGFLRGFKTRGENIGEVSGFDGFEIFFRFVNRCIF
jgi:hypothetical protein